MEIMEFLTVLLMVFALVMILAGIFTAYFGSGKSRTIGVILLVIGLVVGIIWTFLGLGYGGNDIIHVDLAGVIWTAFLYILAALIGILGAVGIFLLAIMKA
jgi:hypothetical protein